MIASARHPWSWPRGPAESEPPEDEGFGDHLYLEVGLWGCQLRENASESLYAEAE